MVFDDAAKFNQTCLNEYFSVLKFQSGRYALTSDIKQVFHQVRIIQSDSDALRFL